MWTGDRGHHPLFLSWWRKVTVSLVRWLPCHSGSLSCPSSPPCTLPADVSESRVLPSPRPCARVGGWPCTPSPILQGGPGGADGGGADGQAAASPPPAAVQVTSVRLPGWADGDVAWAPRRVPGEAAAAQRRDRATLPTEAAAEPTEPTEPRPSALPSGTRQLLSAAQPALRQCLRHAVPRWAVPRSYVSCFHCLSAGRGCGNRHL